MMKYDGNMDPRQIVPALVLVASAFGCAASRPGIHPGSGYEEARLDSTSYVVAFQGDAHTGGVSVRRAVLTRWAELTRESGRGYFILLAIATTGYQDDVHTPDQATSGRGPATPAQRTTGTDTPTGVPVRAGAQVPGEWIQVTRYKTTVTMRMCSDTRPQDNPNAHAVDEFLEAPRQD